MSEFRQLPSLQRIHPPSPGEDDADNDHEDDEDDSDGDNHNDVVGGDEPVGEGIGWTH